MNCTLNAKEWASIDFFTNGDNHEKMWYKSKFSASEHYLMM